MDRSERPYKINRADLTAFRHTPKTPGNNGSLVASACHGSRTSWLFAERSGGYRSPPHRHDAEQINYFVSGEMWLFIEDRGYRCSAGDVVRIPPGKWHWAFNPSDKVCVMIESHSPPVSNKQIEQHSVALLGADEADVIRDDTYGSVEAIFPGNVDEIERREIAAFGSGS